MVGVERTTMRMIERDLPTSGIADQPPPEPPGWAVAVPAYTSGYVQMIRPELLVERMVEQDLLCAIVPMVGEHLIVGEPIAWLWSTSASEAPLRTSTSSRRASATPCASATSAPPSRTSPSASVSSPTSPRRRSRRRSTTPTPVCRRLEHLAMVLADLARRPLGDQLLHRRPGTPRVARPAATSPTYVELGDRAGTPLRQQRAAGARPRCCGCWERSAASVVDDVRRHAVADAVALVGEAAEHVDRPGRRPAPRSPTGPRRCGRLPQG